MTEAPSRSLLLVVNQDPGLGADGRLGVLMLCAVTPDIVYDESDEEMVPSGLSPHRLLTGPDASADRALVIIGFAGRGSQDLWHQGSDRLQISAGCRTD